MCWAAMIGDVLRCTRLASGYWGHWTGQNGILYGCSVFSSVRFQRLVCGEAWLHPWCGVERRDPAVFGGQVAVLLPAECNSRVGNGVPVQGRSGVCTAVVWRGLAVQ